jgi:GT2 family glycosyltransferase
MRKLGVAVVTFNSEDCVLPCLDSLYRQASRDFALVVVDNGSMDNTVSLIKSSFPDIMVVENKSNLGACKARNQVIDALGSEWVLTLDCDVVLEDDFMGKISTLLDTVQPEVGIVQPKILSADKKRIYSGGIRLSWLKRFFGVGKNRIDRGQYNAPRYVFGACAAAGIYRRTMLEAVKDEYGYFDERFFFLVEDVDIALRAQGKGWKALYSPEACCYHAGGSSGLGKKLIQYLCWRNRRLLLKKCSVPFAQAVLICAFYDVPRDLVLFFSNRHVRDCFLGRS